MAGKPLDDHLTLDCKLGRIALLHRVYEHIVTSDPPFVVGVHGDWGAGKSSFLMQLEGLLTGFSQARGKRPEPPNKQEAEVRDKLQANLAKTTNYPVVWFEAWRYQNDPQPIVTLLREIRNQLSPSQNAWNSLRKESSVVIETALAGIDGIIAKFTGFKAGPKEIRERGERYEAEHFMAPSLTVSMTEVLEQAIKQVIAKIPGSTRANRLVVIIDDLDRCSPETAQAILEGLKVFLQLNNTVFVIAMDESVVADFIGKSFKDSEADVAQRRRRARQYIEKLCQSIYRLPFSVSAEDLFSQILLERCGDDAPAKALANDLKTQMTGLSVVPPNPRKIKLLAEVTYRFIAAAKPIPTPVSLAALGYVLAYCYQFEPEMYRLVETQKETFYQEVLQMAVTLGSDSTYPMPVQELVMPRKYRSVQPASGAGGRSVLTDLFPDPIRDGVFYPADLVVKIGSVTRTDIEALIA